MEVMSDWSNTCTLLQLLLQKQVRGSDFKYVSRQSESESGLLCAPGEKRVVQREFLLLGESGDLLVHDNETAAAVSEHATFRYDKYCVERYGALEVDAATGAPEEGSDSSLFPLRAVVCAPGRGADVMGEVVLPVLFVISLVFLGLLFAYIYFKPKSLHPQGRPRAASAAVPQSGGAGRSKPPLTLFELMTLCLVAMLFLFYVFLIVAKLAQESLVRDYPSGCVAIGLLTQVKTLLFLMFPSIFY